MLIYANIYVYAYNEDAWHEVSNEIVMLCVLYTTCIYMVDTIRRIHTYQQTHTVVNREAMGHSEGYHTMA